jgi:energy-coupling factor transporter transmembrane protein EcfT
VKTAWTRSLSSIRSSCRQRKDQNCFVLFVVFVLFSLVLFCFVLFCFVLFCFVLFCFVLFCFVLFCFVLFCFVLFCVVLFVVLTGWTKGCADAGGRVQLRLDAVSALSRQSASDDSLFCTRLVRKKRTGGKSLNNILQPDFLSSHQSSKGFDGCPRALEEIQ